MQTRIVADVAKLVLAVMVFTSVTAAHAQDRTAEYKAYIASVEHFNRIQREADMPEMSVLPYEEWLKAEQDGGTGAATAATASAAPVAAMSSGQGGSPPPSAPLSGGHRF